MAVFKEGGGGSLLDGSYVDTDKLGSGKGTPQGKKFLTDNQTFDSVDSTQIDSGAATSGQVLTADGLGGASWQDGGVTYTVREYTSSDTWTKPSGLHEVFVVCISGGPGGGSGRRGAAGTNRYGGVSGSSGCLVWYRIPEASLGATETVTIGAGGTGGAAVTTDDTNGNSGANGSTTSFGTLVVADAGTGGSGGSTSAGGATAGGSSGSCTPANKPWAWDGGNIFNSTISTGATGYSAWPNSISNLVLIPTGGGGGGLNTSNTERNGGAGGGVFVGGVLTGATTAGVANGARDGGNGSDNLFKKLLFDNVELTYGIGSAGAGGASESDGVTAAGNGGNGGLYGAPGGGGGASANGANSGAGGDGGGGICIVLEVTA